MAEGAIFVNSGPLFNADRLESLEDLAEWKSLEENARVAFERLREVYEKCATLLAGNPSALETRFHIVNPTLHAARLTFSVEEAISVGDDQALAVDYACFANAQEFYDAEATRGTVAFFRSALCIVQCAAWGADLDTAPEPTPATEEGGEPQQTVPPAVRLDLLLRTTGCEYGILTNGFLWRVYHRDTSGLLNTFFQADMIAAMKTDYEEFKRFYLLFNRQAFVRDAKGQCFLDTIRQ
jgi:hypothetical protein